MVDILVFILSFSQASTEHIKKFRLKYDGLFYKEESASSVHIDTNYI